MEEKYEKYQLYMCCPRLECGDKGSYDNAYNYEPYIYLGNGDGIAECLTLALLRLTTSCVSLLQILLATSIQCPNFFQSSANSLLKSL